MKAKPMLENAVVKEFRRPEGKLLSWELDLVDVEEIINALLPHVEDWANNLSSKQKKKEAKSNGKKNNWG